MCLSLVSPVKAWREITSELSGQFCASINFIDNSATVQPKYSFRPEGVVDGTSLRNGSLFYGALPHEAVCTENLTPWKKLLPCFAHKGLATLLNANHLFNSYYFSMAIDFRPVCRVSYWANEFYYSWWHCLQLGHQLRDNFSWIVTKRFSCLQPSGRFWRKAELVFSQTVRHYTDQHLHYGWQDDAILRHHW